MHVRGFMPCSELGKRPNNGGGGGFFFFLKNQFMGALFIYFFHGCFRAFFFFFFLSIERFSNRVIYGSLGFQNLRSLKC